MTFYMGNNDTDSSMPRRWLHQPSDLQPQRRAPQWRLGELAALGTEHALGAVHVQEPGPAPQVQHLDV